MPITSFIFIIGLLFDIIGAFFLAQSFIRKNLADLTYEGTSGYGSPPNLPYIKSSIVQKAEAKIGFGFLTTGFILQSLDYFYTDRLSVRQIEISFVILLLLLILLLIPSLGFILKKLLLKKYGFKMALIVVKIKNLELEQNHTYTVKVAEYLVPSFKRIKNEGDGSFAERFLIELKK